MPIEVAEWYVKKLERGRAGNEELLLAQFDVSSAAELEDMDAAELLTRALRKAPEQAIALGACRCLGHVLDGDRAYVLFWLGPEGEPHPFEEPSIATVERVADQWRLSLDPHGRWGVPGFRNIGFVNEAATEEGGEE